ncbi:hypothetical protein ACX0G9_07040 [Flavitalea flava]
MTRKYVSIAFVFVAYSILLLHSVVPHHHHGEGTPAGLHRNADQDDDDDDHDDHNAVDHNFLSHAFAHFHHGQGIIITYTHFSPEKFGTTINWAVEYTPSSAHFILLPLPLPPLIPPLSRSLLFVPIPIPLHHSLRGPPTVVA